MEQILPAEETPDHASCLGGARAFPPEDCGGVFGYLDLLDAFADPEHPDHEDALDWLGEDFDPEAFDLEGVNAALATVQ